MTLTEAIDALVKNSFDAQKTWKETLENQSLGESMLSMRLLFDLLDKDICNQIITSSQSTSESSVHNFAISLFAKNYGTEDISNAYENILVSHIELMIQSLIKNGKISEINRTVQRKGIHFAEDLQAAITQLIKLQGTEALKNTHRAKAMLPDLTGGKFKNEISDFCSFMEQLNSGNEFTDKETAEKFLSLIETACNENSLEIPGVIIEAKEKINVVIPKETATTENNTTDTQSANGQELFSAIENGDIEKINTLIDNGADVNVRDENGYTPLMLASKKYMLKTVEKLLLAGADVNVSTAKHGLTALMVAAEKGDSNIASLLINAGADINCADTENAWTALVYAIRDKSIDVVKLLLDNGAEVNKVDLHSWSPIMRAVVTNSVPITQMLLDSGADISKTLPNGQKLSSLADIYQADEVMPILTAALEKNKPAAAQTHTESDNSSASKSSTQTSTNDGWAELVKEKEAHKKTKVKFGVFLTLSIIAGIVAVYFYNEYNLYSRSYWQQNWQIRDLQAENKKLTEDSISGIQDSFFDSPVAVKITKVYNYANNSTNLRGSEITYLDFDYTVFKLPSVNSNEKLYVKVINPDGTLRIGQSSPNGYSFTVDMNSTSAGWGNETPGNYSTRGNYTIEFWYQSVCVGRKVVTIN